MRGNVHSCKRSYQSKVRFSFFCGSSRQGIDVYVLDSGINIGHSDFGGRAFTEINFVSNESEGDLGGHGKE